MYENCFYVVVVVVFVVCKSRRRRRERDSRTVVSGGSLSQSVFLMSYSIRVCMVDNSSHNGGSSSDTFERGLTYLAEATSPGRNASMCTAPNPKMTTNERKSGKAKKNTLSPDQ